MLILLGEGKNNNDNNYDVIAIWAEHIGIARFAKDYFKNLWEDGKKVKKEY